MSQPLSRRGLLRGRFVREETAIRPPWSLPEAAFVEACTRCGDCIAACPEAIIVKGDGGFPEIDFSAGPCTFCAACRDACPTGAIMGRSDAAVRTARDAGAWRLKAGILPHCVSLRGVVCRLCEEACEPQAIDFQPLPGGAAKPVIDIRQCTGCGGCYSACPVGAVTLTEKE